ncbi:hypothetical protein RB653_001504 [Dictyostelium firmibasis]|uniref:Small GTPase n=1 Tax=Dictyostelium firmibasis TaxID=79012 RepID=A0AAN7U570_9MYCE
MGNTSSSSSSSSSSINYDCNKQSKNNKKYNNKNLKKNKNCSNTIKNNLNCKKEEPKKNYKLITLGSSGVGKTSISFRFVSNIFITEYDPTVEDAYKKDYVFDGKELKLELIDTAGQEEYSSGLHDKAIRSCDGFILVFSITSRESFQKIKDLREKILWVKDKDRVPMVIVGNKSDMEKDRRVSKNEARSLAEEFECRYIETSAKTSENIELLFNNILGQVVDKKR